MLAARSVAARAARLRTLERAIALEPLTIDAAAAPVQIPGRSPG